MFKLKNYLAKYKWLSIIGPFLKFLETMTDIVTPYFVAKILDIGVANGDVNYVIKTSLFVILINTIGVILAMISQKCSSLTSEGIGRDLRRDMFEHINTFSYAELDKFTTVGLTNRVINDTEQLQTAIGMTIRNVARAPFLLIGSAVMALILNVKMSIVFVIVMPIIFLIAFLTMKKTAPLHYEAKLDLDNVSNITRENLSGIRVVRAFNKQAEEEKRFVIGNNKLVKTNLTIGQIAALMRPLTYTVLNLAIVAIIWVGGFQINIGTLTTGAVIAFMNYFRQIAASLMTMARIIIVYTRTSASIKRIKEVFALQNSIVDPKRPVHIDKNEADIEFKNVSFSYSNVKDAIKKLNIKIKSGDTIGVIGGTGSGKSSIVNLIPRFYDVTKGQILLNGKNIKRYKVDDLRSMIGIVPQNPILFKGTIRENMKWRKVDASDEEIIKALIVSQAYDFVKLLPEFLDHKVERGGTNFSGGQKQRLTIARALVGSPQILILDDSSSALDFATDAALRKGIARNLKNVTTFIVSQRTNTIKNADKIIVLDNGIVAGIGTHNELLKKCDVYQEIYYSQNKREAINEQN